MQKKTHAVNPFYCGLTVHRYTEYSKKLTKRLRAALITDLHSTIYGSAQEPILKALQSHRADLVLMAGDIADHKVPHKGTLLLLEGLKGQYPCYYVTGNHEHWIHQIPDIKKMFTGYGVTVLGGQTIRTTIKGQPLIIGGVD
ncbi:MAG: metallophosphoesterase, partial [Enterocloster clostridioformis]|nr:metallophosphoesterase [Enterocloster clostridioformis]